MDVIRSGRVKVTYAAPCEDLHCAGRPDCHHCLLPTVCPGVLSHFALAIAIVEALNSLLGVGIDLAPWDEPAGIEFNDDWRYANSAQKEKELVTPLPLKRLLKIAKSFGSRSEIVVKEEINHKKNNESGVGKSNWTWNEVQKSILEINLREESIVPYVIEAFTRTPHVSTLVCLSRSSISSKIIKDYLSTADFGPQGPLWSHMKSSRYCAGLLCAAVIAETQPVAQNLLSRVRELFPVPNSNFGTIVDSFGSRLVQQPSDAHLRALPASLDPGVSEHTLLIAPGIDGDMQSLSILFGNTQKVTVLFPCSLAERVDLSGLPVHSRPGAVRIEAARTRIGRYSSDYQRLHFMTWPAATKIVDKIDAVLDGVWGAARPFAETWLADVLFFDALKAASVIKLIESEDFDRVVVAVDGSPASADLCRVLGTVAGFASDPRVVVTSLASTENARLRFSDEVSAICGHAPEAPSKARVLASEAMVDQLKIRGKRLAAHFDQFGATDRPRVLFSTAPETSYDAASVSYFAELAKAYDCMFASINTSASDQLARAAAGAILHISQSVASDPDLASLLSSATDEVEKDPETPAQIANILRSRRRSLAENSIPGFLQLWITIQQWFDAMESRRRLPNVVVVTPARNSRAMLIAAAARQKQIPSLSLEPHIQRTTYCRSGRILTDYFGVMSTYLQQISESDERIDSERCRIIGSPRIVGARQYDYVERTEAARSRLTAKGIDFAAHRQTVSFFSQSTQWEQINAVWQIVLKSTDGLGVQILLKGHPEDGPARIERYLATAKELGAQDRVKCTTSDMRLADIIESSDMVLSCFSTVLLEAVLCRRPTAAVINGAFDYPTAVHEVAGMPIYRNEYALRQAVESLPNEFERWQLLISNYLAKEGQFLGELGDRLRALVDELVHQPTSKSLRRDLPRSVFLNSRPAAYDI